MKNETKTRRKSWNWDTIEKTYVKLWIWFVFSIFPFTWIAVFLINNFKTFPLIFVLLNNFLTHFMQGVDTAKSLLIKDLRLRNLEWEWINVKARALTSRLSRIFTQDNRLWWKPRWFVFVNKQQKQLNSLVCLEKIQNSLLNCKQIVSNDQ